MSAAFVAVTRHFPAPVAVSELPVILQPVAVPLATVKLTAPLPEPPLVTRVSAVPSVPDNVVMRSEAWATGVVWLTRKIGSLENVMVTVPFAVAVPTAARPVEVSS